VQVNIMIKAAVGWQPLPKRAVVSVRKCTGRALHTFHGLIGYCFKDEGQSWFQVHLYNVGDEDIERGKVCQFHAALRALQSGMICSAAIVTDVRSCCCCCWLLKAALRQRVMLPNNQM
jgi:hypothetical protein